MQEKLTRILADLGGAIDVARDLMLELPSKEDRTEAIQATIARATQIIEACVEASKDHEIEFTILDHTMRFPEWIEEPDIDDQGRPLMVRVSVNGLNEARLVSQSWWDSSDRGCS